ncbi:MAG: site-specific integrase [Polyangiaceae bacterium]
MTKTSKGGRPATGYVEWRRNAKTGVEHWHVQVTLADKSRPFVPLDATIPKHDREAAQACARETSAWMRKHGAVVDRDHETVTHYAIRWCRWREGKKLGCVDGDRALLERHILHEIGGFDVRTIARDDLKRLVGKLDAKVAAGKSSDGKPFSAKTAINAWGVARALFRDAQRAKDVTLCVREDNPAEGVAGPDAGAKKAKTYLWPSEFDTLVRSERVPRRWRRLFALAVCTYTRAGELTALRWEGVDLEHRTMLIHVAEDRVRKRGVRATKTETARRIPIEPALMPLLVAMHKEAGGKGPVFRMPSVGVLSYKLKFYLRRAGVDRADLFASDETRKAITFHDLRATGITWMAARGDDPLRIMQRAGHADFETTKIYMREAENLAASFGDVFPTLPDDLLGFANDSQPCETDEANEAELLANVVELTGIETFVVISQ